MYRLIIYNDYWRFNLITRLSSIVGGGYAIGYSDNLWDIDHDDWDNDLADWEVGQLLGGN